MDAVRVRTVIAEDDLDRVANFSPDDGPDEAEVALAVRTRLEMRERRVSVLSVDGLAIHRPDEMLPALRVRLRVTFRSHAHHVVDPPGK